MWLVSIFIALINLLKNYLFQFYVHTMHKYVPVLTIRNLTTGEIASNIFKMEIAQFFPVSIYQQASMGRWKSDLNKHSTFGNRSEGGIKRKTSDAAGQLPSKRSSKKPVKKDVVDNSEVTLEVKTSQYLVNQNESNLTEYIPSSPLYSSQNQYQYPFHPYSPFDSSIPYPYSPMDYSYYFNPTFQSFSPENVYFDENRNPH